MKIKKCYDCKKEFPIEDFPVNSSKRDGRHHLCKDCKNLRERKRRRSLEKTKRYNRKAHHKRKIRYYSILDKYREKKCEICEYVSEYWAPFDFHHRDPSTKEYEVSSMVRHTEEKIKKELDKCIVLCSNCHRLLHYQEVLNEEN